MSYFEIILNNFKSVIYYSELLKNIYFFFTLHRNAQNIS